MSEERLKEIKVSLDFQVTATKAMGYDETLLNEELELYNEVIRLREIVKEVAEEILKELEEYHHLSYGVALSIRQKIIDYNELKENNNENNNNL